ncbi:response regulator [Rhizobium sp. Leaf391]|uniref:response regulator n=1 Tax=Rhizobium sp. Leaf391 TaxID=1736360 RepID=UPI0009E9BBFF|nr:response regulator [Rhizobium sp. Leaf391]
MTLNPVVVLIVEDEPVIRMSVVEELQHAGVVVFEAGTADESLTILQANPEISSVFTDVDMPGTMSGTELARIVRNSRPSVTITLTSAYLKLRKGELPPEVGYIPKPYDIDHVLRQIHPPALV